jgi:hypothetical protein
MDARLPFTWLTLLAAGITALLAPAVLAQWSYETVDANPNSRAAAWMGVAGDGTIVMMYSGPTDGMSCDGTADVFIKVRVGPNNWVEPAAAYSPYRLRVTRPHMVVNTQGDIFIVYELRWAYYTGLVKLTRTGPNTWVREADPVLIKAPAPVPCGSADPNIPSTAYLYGYNPKVAVAPNGSLHVFANRVVDGQTSCVCAFNSGADWRTGWTISFTRPGNGNHLVCDSNSAAHLSIVTANDDPNLNNNLYVKLQNGSPVVGPIEIQDGGARTGDAWIAISNATAYLISMQWNTYGDNTWNGWGWTINGTQVSNPSNITQQSAGAGTCCVRVVGRNGCVRYYWRKDAQDARWAWYFTNPGFPHERITLPGHDTGGVHIQMDSAGNYHAAFQDFDASGPKYKYAYRASDAPPPGPLGTIAGVVRNQYGQPIPNAAVSADTAAITTSGPDGSYSLSVPVYTYNLTASKAFYSGPTIGGVVVIENRTTIVDPTISGLPPAPANSFTATPGNTRNTLAWTNPGSANFSGTMIRCKTTGYPSGPTDGSLVFSGTGTSFTHENLTNGVTHYYAAFAYYDDIGKYYASPILAQATPHVPADFDHDGDVDQIDFGHLQECFSGDFVPQDRPECQDTRLSTPDDLDVDPGDLEIFIGCLSGPGAYADPQCMR